MTDIASLLDMAGKTAIVTGAASGIGRETARLLAAAGARVAGGDLSFDGTATDEALAMQHRLDVSDEASVRNFVDAVVAELGGVDILVNAAGIFPQREFEDVDAAFWDKVNAVNTRGTFLINQAVVIAMRQRGGGAIVNISSSASLKAVIARNIQYNASKAGVNAITVSVALEEGPNNIRCNAILPGGIATEGAGKSVEDAGGASGPITQPGRIPLTGNSAPPSAIANAALFLVSDASSYITGQLLSVDGGFSVS